MKKKYIKMYNNINLYIWSIAYKINKFYYSDNFIKLYSFIIMPLLLASQLYLTYDVLLCDDGYNNLSHETYNLSYESEYRDRSVYQPYRPGLHNTSEGYRYELPDNSIGSPKLRVQLNGEIIYAEYSGQDFQGNPIYTYNNHSFSINSTKLGEIEPTRSEIINEAYYKGGGWGHKDVITTKFNSKPGIWNKIKSDFKNARDSANRNQKYTLDNDNAIIKDVRLSRAHNEMARLSRRNHVNYDYSYHRKVRRFD